MTQQRRVILEELQRLKAHPSADEVYAIVRKRLPRISLGTVYRNLEILSELGLIQKLEISGSIKRFDWKTEKHYHIRCINCDRIDDAPIKVMQDVEHSLDGSTGYKVTGHSLEFLGLCPVCMEKAMDRDFLESPMAEPEDPEASPKASNY